MSVLVLLMACSDYEDRDQPYTDGAPAPPGDTVDTAVVPDTDAFPTPTATVTTTDCDDLTLDAPFFTIDIGTQEDFDFDGFGYLIHQNGGSLAGMSYEQDLRIIVPGIGDTAGIQMVSTGAIVYASPFSGSIRTVDPEGGSDTLLAGGLSFPDGLEVGAGDRIYYSERASPGRVRYIDLETRETATILDNVDVPNGLALSPDETTLYIAGGFGVGIEGIIAVDKDDLGVWGAPRSVVQANSAASFDGVEVDVCGNVYAVGWSDGRLSRTTPDGVESVIIADLSFVAGQWSLFNSIRWGSGYGGWRRDVLYVTDRSQIYAVEVGVLGRKSPVAATY